MKRLLFLFVLSFFFVSGLFITTQHAIAADIRQNDTIVLSSDEKNLEDLYLFGGDIRVDAPVTNDLVSAGGNTTLNSDVSGSVISAGGNITIKGPVGNTIRVAGGNIIIDGKVSRDIIVAGGSVTLTKNASVGGDLIIFGGQVNIEAPVQGKVLLYSENATINSQINKNVDAEVGQLTLGPNAVINGNLSYKAPKEANTNGKAVVQGKTDFKKIEKNTNKEKEKTFIAAGTIYKLLADIIVSILLILLLARFIQAITVRMANAPVRSGVYGFAYFILFPIASVFFLILIWLGIASFLLYFLSMIITVYLVKIFIGWILLKWWEGRNNQEYVLDWKAGVLGPIIAVVLSFIPVIGWFVLAIIFLIALGSLTQELLLPLSQQKIDRTALKKKR